MTGSDFILVVDDDADTLTMLTYIVKKLPGGYRVATAISGEEAVEYLRGDGRFADRNIAYEEVAEPRFAIEVAKELGYKVP